VSPGPWPRTTRLWPALWLCVWAGSAQAALRLEPVDGSLTPAEAAATRELLADAAGRLPAAWSDALPPRIEVKWRDDLPAQVHGRASARRMLLARALLDGWMARPPRGGTEDPAARAALAAVIHELAHFYDRSPQGRLSRDARFLDLAGWQVRPMRPGLRTRANAFSDRSPDRYELQSPAEFVAVNLELFLLDPAYACRRPALYGYFAVEFGSLPPRADCAPDLVYLQVGSDASLPPVLNLDPERVYAVEYLFAEGNDRPISRWGHSMLRLVICASGRARGPDCRLDLQYHQVLSFRAFIDDVQISSWRGLTGSYPSRLYVLPLAQVIEEYTKVELRGLQSIPLRFEPAEIADLLERSARLHWSYDGDYYFLSNNCAVETFKLLHDGVPRLAGEDLSSITPTGLLRRLRRAGIADGSVLEDRAEALRLGYYFEALSERYQAMFDVARRCCCSSRQRCAASSCCRATSSSDGSSAAMRTGRRGVRKRSLRFRTCCYWRATSAARRRCCRTAATACRSSRSARRWRRRAHDSQRSGASRAAGCERRLANGCLPNGCWRWMPPRPMSRRWASGYGGCIESRVVFNFERLREHEERRGERRRHPRNAGEDRHLGNDCSVTRYAFSVGVESRYLPQKCPGSTLA
jgi:hypothetical protein